MHAKILYSSRVVSNGTGSSVKARRVVAGVRSRKWPSSEGLSMRPLRVPGDIMGDGARRGVMGGASRIGDEKAAMVMSVGGKERRRGHV